MTFIEAITAFILLVLFFFGFSQAFLPTYSTWIKAQTEYSLALTINFIAESFRNECARPDRNMENWKDAVTCAKELEYYEITELFQGEELRALRLFCIISSIRLEIIGLCAQ